MASASARLVCLPSWDDAFVGHVEAVMATSPKIESPFELEQALRPAYPLARVRPSELSGLRTPTWYVYRDGRFPWPS